MNVLTGFSEMRVSALGPLDVTDGTRKDARAGLFGVHTWQITVLMRHDSV